MIEGARMEREGKARELADRLLISLADANINTAEAFDALLAALGAVFDFQEDEKPQFAAVLLGNLANRIAHGDRQQALIYLDAAAKALSPKH